jgi:hypothetical protein
MGHKRGLTGSGSTDSLDLAKHSVNAPSCLRIHRQEVDHIGPVLTVQVSVAHQDRGDCVAVGVVRIETSRGLLTAVLLWCKGQIPYCGTRTSATR